MKQRFAKLVCKFGTQLCAAAMVVAPMASQLCRHRFYQPEEPEGLAEFAKRRK